MSRGHMDPGMAPVMERFPEHATSIQARFHADQRFREMCSDYAETLQALQRWRVSRGPHKAARVEEYRELARALEIEIVTALRSPAPGKHWHHFAVIRRILLRMKSWMNYVFTEGH